MGTIFFLSLMAVFAAANLLWWRRVDGRMRGWPGGRVWRRGLGCFVGGMILYVATVGSMGAGHWLPMPIHVFAYLWNILVLPVTLVCMALVGIGVKGVKGRDAKNPAAGAAAWRELPTRRRVLSMAAAAVPPLVAVGLTGVAEAELGGFRIRRISLPLAGLPGDLEGVTIAQVTDVHIGRFLPDGTLPRIVEAVRGLNADVIAFTGDVLDASQKEMAPAIEFLQALRPAGGQPYAIVEGNHDVTHGAEAFESAVLGAGLPLLLDSSMVARVPGRATAIRMCGISWGRMVRGREVGQLGEAGRRLTRKNDDPAMAESVKTVAAQRLPGEFPLLLVHHPHAFDPAATLGFPLTLAGHTHGGQIMLTPTIGAGPMRFRYWAGTHSRGDSRLVISNGVGNWFPLRINAPTEIVHITLHGQ